MENVAGVERREYQTGQGSIVYWTSAHPAPDLPWLVFLPGLTADHRLFDKQVEYFADKANVLVWDAPSHGDSRPFPLTCKHDDGSRWRLDNLVREGVENHNLVRHSLGG